MRTFFTLILLAIGLQTQAQDEGFERNENKHEFRLDALEALAVPNLEFSYEYVNNKYSGFGASISFSLDDEFSEYQKFAFTPYYRQYFLNKKDFGARGLFVEGLMRFAAGDGNQFLDINNNRITEDDWFDVGIGLAVGQKWVSDNGFVFELSIGGGRYLLDENPDGGFIRGGVLIGYRFF